MKYLSAAQKEHFESEGYLLVENFWDPVGDIEPLLVEYTEVLDQLAQELLAKGAIKSTYAGLPFSAGFILKAAEERFGPGARPNAIVLTHGHFDHVGSLKTLAEQWDVPIYAHPLEHPYRPRQRRAAKPTSTP